MHRVNPYTGTMQDRVNFACAFVLSGRDTTREFDTCFEMGDGEEVAARIYRRALSNPTLMDAARRYLSLDLLRRAYEAEILRKNPAQAVLILD